MKDLKDFEQLYIQHWEKLYAFCFKMTRDGHLSQNIVQDVFTDLWERQDKLHINSIENYLFRAAKNQVFKAYRNQRFDTTPLDERFDDYQAEISSEAENERIVQLYNLLENLPEKRKEILIMSKLEQMDIEQIAVKLNLSPQTVKNQISNALKQLRYEAGELSLFLLILLLSLTIL
ncbi:RNA polymerase sigma-70 factor [Pedobacter sp. GR22-6]|uniref:RNA polymerase sigma-70 factor n=1 Tax=Pedobacter sp. GR22-6 TaxID=3127957 RepID=UPI00307EC5C8